MARDPFPTRDFGRGVSPGLPGGAVGAPGAGAAGALADAARRFSGRLQKAADTALEREGLADAAKMVDLERNFGVTAALRPGQGVDDQAYNTSLRAQHLANRQAEYANQLSVIETANPDSEAAFVTAHTAMDAAFVPTGDAETDLAFNRFRTIENQQALNRVRRGQEQVRRETVRGAYVSTATTAGTALGQAVMSAGLTDEGAALVGLSLHQYATQLARFGPREAFSIGGFEFAADPTRAGVVGADVLAADFNRAQTEARMAWVIAAGDRVPDAAAKQAYAGQVRERWEAGDPMFAGLDAADMGRLSARLDNDAQSAAVAERAAISAAGDRARDLLKALEFGGDVDPADIRAAAEASGDPGLIAEADYRLTYGFQISPRDDKAPGGFGAPGSGGAVGPGFGPWVGVLLDQMEGPGLVPNDNGRGRAQYGITEASHPEAWRDGRIDRAEAANIYKRQYWDAIGGDSLPPELAFAAASSAVIGGVGTARELLSQANGDVDRFLSLEEARFRRLAAQEPAKYGDDLPGWLNRLGRVRGAIGGMRAQRRAAEGYATDPIGYARGTTTRAGLAPISEFDPGAPFGGDVAAWGAAIQQRRATGRELSRRDGVPARILASEEVAFYKDAFERDPGAVVALATPAYQAIGPDGARELFNELGRGGAASSDLRLGWLASEPSTRGFAARVVEGRRLRAEGGVAPAFPSGEGIADRAPQYARALTAQPQVLAAITALAEDRAYADMATGQLQSADAYLQGALGGTNRNGARFGGLTNLNGAATLSPTWLQADRMDDMLEEAARLWVAGDQGPVYANGQAIPSQQLLGYRMLAMPNGGYRLIHPRTGNQAVDRSGRAFEFNPEYPGFRDHLARRLPGAVLPEAR